MISNEILSRRTVDPSQPYQLSTLYLYNIPAFARPDCVVLVPHRVMIDEAGLV